VEEVALPFIDEDKCTACGKCVEVCPARCIESKSIARLVRPEKCISCGRCARICPSGAITLKV